MRELTKLRVLVLSLMSIVMTTSLQGQLINSHLEHTILTNSDTLKNGWTISLPSVTGTVISKGYTYGDIIEAETNTLRLDIAGEQNADFHLLGSVRGSYGGLTWHHEGYGIMIGHEWIADIGASVPESTLDILVDGNAGQQSFTLDPSAYFHKSHRLSLGAYKAWGRGLLGFNVYYLGGVETLVTQSASVEVLSLDDFFDVEFFKDIEVQSSGVVNYNGIDDIDFTASNSLFSASPFTVNRGGGLSVFGRVALSDRVDLYAVVDDIGRITWTRQAVTYSDQTTAQYSGIDIKEVFLGDSFSARDTLTNLLNIDKIVGEFSASLAPVIAVGAQIGFNEKISIDASWRSKIVNGGLRSIVGLRGNYQLDNLGTVSVNTALAGGSIANIGVGYSTTILDRLGLYFYTTNPWFLGSYVNNRYGHLSAGMYIRL